MDSSPLILVWVEQKKLKGVREVTYIGYTMSQDGSPLGQMAVPSIGWAKDNLGVTTTLRHDKYAEEYPLGFEVCWLEHPEQDARWWRAKFFRDNLWEITFVEGSPPYVEFRDERMRKVIGYVVHLVALDTHYVIPGRASPREGDEYPGPAMSFRDAMIEANTQFCTTEL